MTLIEQNDTEVRGEELSFGEEAPAILPTQQAELALPFGGKPVQLVH